VKIQYFVATLYDACVISRFLTNCILFIHLSAVDTCHVIGTLHWYKYWPLVRFLPAVSKCDISQSNRLRLFTLKFGTFYCFFYELFVFDKQTSDVCLLPVTSSQVHQSWDHGYRQKACTFQQCSDYCKKRWFFQKHHQTLGLVVSL
jgi:hypothetical protein